MAKNEREGESTTRSSGGPTELPPQFGRYRVLKKLGGGGMGTVYLVENTELEREETLKVPHFSDSDDSQVRERFLREAKSAAKMDHANLCPVYDAGVLDGIYYLTMRFLNGKLLSQYTGKAQPERKAVEIATKLAQALEAAHGKGVIHRDLKPSNVMMVGGVGPVVMDFGLAKQILQVDQKLTQTGATLGTPAYMSPEQVTGELERIGPATDVYSLGVILYELLTGRLPFQGTAGAMFGQILFIEPRLPSELVPGLNPALDGICRKAMAKAPADRYPSMKAFAAALIDFLRSTPQATGDGKLTPTGVNKLPTPSGASGPQAVGPLPQPIKKPTPLSSDWPPLPPPRSSWKRWLIAVAAVLLAMIGWWEYSSYASNQRAQRFREAANEKRVKEDLDKQNRDKQSREMFDTLTTGMTLKEVAAIIGEKGRQATKSDSLYVSSSPSCEHSWKQAILAGRVRIWERQDILAAFTGDPSSDSKVEALFKNRYASDEGLGLQKPADKWVANKDNFNKLKVGMTLAEVQEIIGIPPTGPIHGSSAGYGQWNPGWEEAVKENRVYIWLTNEIGDWILAAFFETPSATSKVEAFSYVNRLSGAQDKGILSGGEKSPIGKWQEEGYPVTGKDSVDYRTISREFRKDGRLIVRIEKTSKQVSGSWRQENDRIFFSHPSIDGVEPATKDNWFTIQIKKHETDNALGHSTSLSGIMEGERRFAWRTEWRKSEALW